MEPLDQLRRIALAGKDGDPPWYRAHRRVVEPTAFIPTGIHAFARTYSIRALLALAGIGITLTTAAVVPAAAGSYWVNGTSASCSDAGPGTLASPYCTIAAALTAHHAPGDTVLVQPGTYLEQVTVPASGTSGNPIVLKAAGAPQEPTLIEGANDLSSPLQWTAHNDSVFLAPGVNWSPVQVFVDGARLVRSTAAPDTLPSGSFRYIAGDGLYLNAGGDNPGAHHTQVGRRTYGFNLPGRSWVRIDGFTVMHAEDRGVQISGAASNVEVVNNRVAFSGRYGIQAFGASALHIAGNVVSDNGDHGIALTSAVTGSTIEDNESFRNVYAPARQANGLFLAGCSGNTIQRNRFHDNQDTGLHMQGGSSNNLSIQNRSWHNGDHGFDQLDTPSNTHLGDVAYGNFVDGFSFEGSSTDCRLYNSIATDNGLTANGADLRVSASASVGFISNDNLLWNSSSQPPVNFSATPYASVAAYSAASGNDFRTVQADPRFVDSGGGDFHLRAGSPAIDNANSGVASWPATDADGNPRVDDPGTPNQGLGPVTYADRGALEYLQGVASVGPDPQSAGVVRLSPNPFRPAISGAQLAFSIARSGALNVRILDASGRVVLRLLDRPLAAAGRYFLPLDGLREDGRPLPSGMYFYRIQSPEGAQTGRFAILR